MKTLLILVAALSLTLVQAKSVEWAPIKPAHFLHHTSLRTARLGRIIGGSVATRGQIPYQAAIFSDAATFCAGAMISETVVVTAAHCIDRRSSYEVHLGAQFMFSSQEPGHEIVTSQDAQKHENFNGSSSFNFDLAIIRLPAPVTGQYISPIQLPARSQQGDSFENVTSQTSGWGTIDDVNPNLSRELRFAEVEVTSQADCQASYGDEVVTPCHVCVSTQQGTVGICSGDSGAPLTVREDNGSETLIGVASFGHPLGCEKKAPNVYVRLTCYLDWLETNAGVSIRP